MQRRKLAAVEHDNKLLLGRLAVIVQSTKTLDNEINETTATHSMFKKDLLKNRQRIELQKITTENQKILKRIQSVQPAYNHSDWEAHAKQCDRHKKSMALYPEYYDKLEKELLVAKEEMALANFVKNHSAEFNVMTASSSSSPSSSTHPAFGSTSFGFFGGNINSHSGSLSGNGTPTIRSPTLLSPYCSRSPSTDSFLPNVPIVGAMKSSRLKK